MATMTFRVTNNEVEYGVLMVGLTIAAEIGVTEVETKADSQVIMNQVLGLYATKDKKLKK